MNRIQRKRTKGWRMPETAVYVGRPGKLGNPFYDSGDGWIILETNTGLVEIADVDGWTPYEINEAIVEHYRRWLNGDKELTSYLVPPNTEEIRQFVNGRDVACWCSLDKPCHADVIIERLQQ